MTVISFTSNSKQKSSASHLTAQAVTVYTKNHIDFGVFESGYIM